MNYKEFFNKKSIAVIGLGPHGEMVPDIKFLLRNKANVAVYDMRSERRMKDYVTSLKDYGLDRYSFGKINDEELSNFDLIILSPEISKKSFFLKKAIQSEIQIEFPETLFFKLSPPITLVGILGLYGKTTIFNILLNILKKSFENYKNQGIFAIDPESNSGALLHLKKIKKDDVVIARIPESMISHYHDIHISPHVAVITSKINFDILDYQTYNNFIVASDKVVDSIKKEKDGVLKAKILRTRSSTVPTDWIVNTKGKHDRDNISLILQTSELFKVSPEIVREVVEDIAYNKGCLEFVKKVSNVEFYNDSNSITPHSTVSALESFANNKDIVLIIGGAYTGHDYTELVKSIKEYMPKVILIAGSGSLGIRNNISEIENISFTQSISLEEAVSKSLEISNKGGVVIFSPGFDAVGVHISRKERGERFVKIVKSL